MDKELLTISELADRLKVQKSWLYSRTRERGPNSIPKVMVGKYLRFRLGDVIAWIEDKQHGGIN
jgi:excisionase family DNA binding protein